MRIKATEMEKMFRLSPNGIRLYEKYGIIRPERNEQSRYRLYGQDEMQAMGCGIQFRRYGFSMAETAHLLGGADAGEQNTLMQHRVESLEKEIESLHLIRKSLKTNIQRAQQAISLMNTCAVEDKPAMYFLGSQRKDRLLVKKSDTLVGEWIEQYAPHLSAALLLDGPYFTKTDYHEPPLGGVAVDAEIALALGLKPSEHVTYLPPRPCIVTALRMSGEPNLAETIQRVRSYAADNKLTLFSGGVIRLVQCVREQGNIVVTGLLWAPLCDKDMQIGEMR